MYFRRTTTAETEIRGQAIDADERVLIWHISANRDEEIWDDPFVLDMSKRWAERVLKEQPDLIPEQRIERLYLDAFTRSPTIFLIQLRRDFSSAT